MLSRPVGRHAEERMDKRRQIAGGKTGSTHDGCASEWVGGTACWRAGLRDVGRARRQFGWLADGQVSVQADSRNGSDMRAGLNWRTDEPVLYVG